MTNDSLGIRVAHDSDSARATVTVTGEMDVANAHYLHGALEGLPGSATIVLDLHDLRYMDSSGLRVLIVFEKRVRQEGGKLVLTGVQPSLLRLLELTGLDGIFEIAASTSGAAT